MALPPVSDLLAEIQSSDAVSFAASRPEQDVVVLEPNEPGRDYQHDLHGLASYVFLPRATNQPVPVGRDARATVLLDHAAVSRLHMVMAWTGQAWQFMDRSSNGVFLHEQRVPKEQPTTLSYGTPVRLGKALMLRVFTPEGLHALVSQVHSTPVAAPGGFEAEGGFDGAWGAPLTPQDPFRVGAGASAPPPPVGAPPPPPRGVAPLPADFADSGPPPVPASVTEEFELDFDFADAPLDSDFVGDSYDSEATEAYLTPTSPPAAPRAPVAPPPPSPPPPPPPVPEDISFDFDFDDEDPGDGRGGFA